jgi:lysophospholipase L1-like esterase
VPQPRFAPRASRLLALLAALLLVACDGNDDIAGGYLALGDSLGVGVGADVPEEGGYVPRLHERMGEAGDGPAFLNLSWPGLTTRTMIERGHLADAIDAAEEGVDGAAVGLITLTIGGNDGALLFRPCEEGPTASCRAAAIEVIEAFEVNFDEILGALSEAAPDDARILVMAYYNPLLHPDCRYHEQAPLADQVLEGGEALGLDGGLNDRIREIAARHDAVVVETHGLLEAKHLREDCLHPNDAGHAILADRFAEALAD